MTDVDVFVDPSCPWAWVTSRWVKEVAPQRDLTVLWRSYCLEIRDDYGVAPTVPEHYRQVALEGHAVSHRMLRVFEAARSEAGEDAVDRLYSEWGPRFFSSERIPADELLEACVAAAGLDAGLVAAAGEEKWDTPIVESMEVAYAFGGPKTQTPTIVMRTDPPHGFKGPVMAPAPSGAAGLRLWDAVMVLSEEPGFFEMTRPAPTRRASARPEGGGLGPSTQARRPGAVGRRGVPPHHARRLVGHGVGPAVARLAGEALLVDAAPAPLRLDGRHGRPEVGDQLGVLSGKEVVGRDEHPGLVPHPPGHASEQL
jgi:2-hydroxychromene-2-carboxylate isomerase